MNRNLLTTPHPYRDCPFLVSWVACLRGQVPIRKRHLHVGRTDKISGSAKPYIRHYVLTQFQLQSYTITPCMFSGLLNRAYVRLIMGRIVPVLGQSHIVDFCPIGRRDGHSPSLTRNNIMSAVFTAFLLTTPHSGNGCETDTACLKICTHIVGLIPH